MSWTVQKDRETGRTIESIPYTGESEDFSVNTTDKSEGWQWWYSLLQSNAVLSTILQEIL